MEANILDAGFDNAWVIEMNENIGNFDLIMDNEIQPSGIFEPLGEYSGSSNIITRETNSLLATNNWPGEYHFNIHFEDKKTTSTSSWTYSPVRDKLYINMDKPCAVSFFVSSAPPPESIICATAVFSKAEHQAHVVKRCPNHSGLGDSSNISCSAPYDNFIRSCSPLARYVTINQRDCVIIPYEIPHPGMDYTSCIYKFMCLSTCVGGINRRPVQVIFTLESNGQVLGRRALDLKVCASPYRDRKVEDASSESGKKKKVKRDHGTCSSDLKTKKIKIEKNIDVFVLKVRGRENYEILKKVRDGLELSSVVRKEDFIKPESSDGE